MAGDRGLAFVVIGAIGVGLFWTASVRWPHQRPAANPTSVTTSRFRQTLQRAAAKSAAIARSVYLDVLPPSPKISRLSEAALQDADGR
jgi:hypothetical protein